MQAPELAAAIETTVRAERSRGAWYGAGAVAGCVALLAVLLLLVPVPAQEDARCPGGAGP